MAKRHLPEAALPRGPRRVLRHLSAPRTLDRRGTPNSATMTEAAGVDPRRLPVLAPMPAAVRTAIKLEGEFQGMEALSDRLYMLAHEEGRSYLYLIRGDLFAKVPYPEDFGGEGGRQELTQFNIYSDPGNPLSGHFRLVGLIYPDSVSFSLATDWPTLERFDPDGVKPRLEHVCVHLSRLFGTADDRIYASAYNDPTDWRVDTSADSGAANAWGTVVQSNSLLSRGFTALTVYDGQVLAFKEGACHVLNNNKNPFRVADLMSVGTPNRDTLAEAKGFLFFADARQVYCYGGDTAEPIGDPLGVTDFTGAIGTARGDLFYLYVPQAGQVFLYSISRRAWSALGEIGEGGIRAMASYGEGCYLLDGTNRLYYLPDHGSGSFSLTLAPAAESGEEVCRLSRLMLTVKAEAGARLRAFYTDSSGRVSPLLDFVARGGTERLVSRTFTPADRAGALSFEGEGDISIHDITIAADIGG